jgi:hypothetical protein
MFDEGSGTTGFVSAPGSSSAMSNPANSLCAGDFLFRLATALGRPDMASLVDDDRLRPLGAEVIEGDCCLEGATGGTVEEGFDDFVFVVSNFTPTFWWSVCSYRFATSCGVFRPPGIHIAIFAQVLNNGVEGSKENVFMHSSKTSCSSSVHSAVALDVNFALP